jgi:dolichyl-phosphate-mannose-protein mannosyltransferase
MMKPHSETDKNSPRVNRSEWTAILLVTLVGICLRIAFPSHMAIEHFDEGVYASNVWFGEIDGFRYPFQHLYAPPLLPDSIEFCVLFFGPSGWGPMFVNLLAGGLTVLLVWWVGRCWFGPLAGIAVAVLCAFSDFHIVFSRTALTDPLSCFWILAAVYFVWNAHKQDDSRWALAAGLTTGLAWWTKYNGWLPLAIGISGVAAWQLFTPRKQRTIKKHILFAMGTVGVAALVWSPVWFGLQSQGGYTAVAENHRQYLVGSSGWWTSFSQQFASHCYLNGWLSCASVGLAFALPMFLVVLKRASQADGNTTNPITNSTQNIRLDFCFITSSIAGVTLLIGLTAWCGASLIIGVLAAVGLILNLFFTPSKSDSQKTTSDHRLAAWLTAAWFCGLLLTTPLYRPYPRLGLPWLFSAWLGCGAFVEWVFQFRNSAPEKITPKVRRNLTISSAIFFTVGVTLLMTSFSRLNARGIPGWQQRDGMKVVAHQVMKKLTEEHRETPVANPPIVVLYIYGEPGLLYQLNAVQSAHPKIQAVTAPVASLNFSASPTNGNSRTVGIYLLVGPHAIRSSNFPKEWQEHQHRFVEVGKPFLYSASDLVLLNEYSAEKIANPAGLSLQHVKLFRLREQ